MSNANIKDNGFIMDFWEKIFYLLSKISLFDLVRKIFKNKIKKKYSFVEKWVVGNLVSAITFSLVAFYTDYNKLLYIPIVYGVLRIFEIIIYQINVIIFDPYRCEKKGETYKVKSISRILVLLIHNFVEIIFWYTLIIIAVVKINNVELIYSWLYYVKASLLCITTFNVDLIVSNGDFLSNIAFIETISGLILTLVCIARFIGILPPVDEIKNELES